MFAVVVVLVMLVFLDAYEMYTSIAYVPASRNHVTAISHQIPGVILFAFLGNCIYPAAFLTSTGVEFMWASVSTWEMSALHTCLITSIRIGHLGRLLKATFSFSRLAWSA